MGRSTFNDKAPLYTIFFFFEDRCSSIAIENASEPDDAYNAWSRNAEIEVISFDLLPGACRAIAWRNLLFLTEESDKLFS